MLILYITLALSLLAVLGVSLAVVYRVRRRVGLQPSDTVKMAARRFPPSSERQAETLMEAGRR